MFAGLKKGDIVIFLTILVAAVLSFGTFRRSLPEGKPVAVIIRDGAELHRIGLEDLKDRKEIRLEDRYNVLIIAEAGRIRFAEADCPDKVCVKTGWISRPGQIAVCLPAGVVIKITGSNEDDVDIYLR